MIKKKIGEIAIEKGWVNSEERDDLLAVQIKMRQEGCKPEQTLFGVLLIQQVGLDETSLQELLTEQQKVTKCIQLNVLEGPYKGKQFVFNEHKRISVGSSRRATICFPEDSNVSSFHCLLEIYPPYNCFVVDTSKKGLFLGRTTESNQVSFQNISDAHVKNGDYIKMGQTVLRIEWDQTVTEEKTSCNKCGTSILASQYVQKDASIWNGKPVCSKCQQSSELLVGKKLGNFEVLGTLGKGGMGIVYKVRHTSTNYYYAVKTILPNISPTEQHIARFIKEVHYGAQLKHKHIVRYYTPGYATIGFFYITMEYIAGPDINKYLKQLQRPLSLAEAKPLILQILEAIEYLHNNQIVHRDIKPSNILLSQEGENLLIKLADFGLAKKYEELGLTGLTLTNQSLGTPAYIPPEQYIDAKSVDGRADIYSASATIYYMLTGNSIYGSNLCNVITTLVEKPIPIHEINPAISKDLSFIIMKCLEKDPTNRFQTIQEFKKALSDNL
jgi:eukaryotic-like serine/threonine-protein kinase